MLETPEVADRLGGSAPPRTCTASPVFRGPGLLRLLQTAPRLAKCHVLMGHQEGGNRPGGHLFASQKLVLLPPNLNGLVYISCSLCFTTLQPVPTESQNLSLTRGSKAPRPKSSQHTISYCCGLKYTSLN